MTRLSLLLLLAVGHVLVCQASPAYQVQELENEKDVRNGDLPLAATDKEEEKSSNDDDDEEPKTGAM
ncbi:unnamed protein product [Dibothriocephalus latus]|uniref:Uncharacterized protein n=1 Tax=Dibothriocephalus latus TaxID=60516 RepID=A0A3P7NV57_DIBLA|nr:unnamed protein product [Dibothriocephalus latus]